MGERRLRLGVAGLGRAFTLMLPTLVADPRVQLVAAADPRGEATKRFAQDFDARVYDTMEALCADPEVDVVYIATPHQDHAAHACLAAQHGKHALIEKPMAITLNECKRMIEAADRAGTVQIVGHSHSFDRPIQRTREIIASGAVGAVRMILAQYYTDFLYRPRRPEELATDRGGGVVFSQAAHQVDIVRLLGGGRARSVRALTGAWDAARPTEGAYTALLSFEDGAIATLTYSGYAHFDSDELCAGIGELGSPKRSDHHGSARRNLRRAGTGLAEADLKQQRNYGGVGYAPPPTQDPAALGANAGAAPWHEHFGLVIASCDRADLRPLPNGVVIYGDDAVHVDPLDKPSVPRSEVIDELYAAVFDGRVPQHDGRWAMATLEVCLAILRSAHEQRDIVLEHQVAVHA